MQKVIAISLVAAVCIAHVATAKAGNIFYSQNEGGGQIVLTDLQGSCPANSQFAYTTSGSGATASGGCWKWMEPLIHVEYADGAVRNYNANGFEATDYAIKRYHLK